jgi:hypothetical protein
MSDVDGNIRAGELTIVMTPAAAGKAGCAGNPRSMRAPFKGSPGRQCVWLSRWARSATARDTRLYAGNGSSL